MTPEEQFEHAFEKAYGLFRYEHDATRWDENEHWHDHSDAILDDKEFIDDCDGFAISVGAVLHRLYDAPKENIYLIRVAVDHEKTYDHAVCGYDVQQVMWIADNRYAFTYRKGWDNYIYHSYRTMADPIWYKFGEA